ncbi:sterile alpha motif domain-containing protein 11 isoform X2 [Amia ocellicauda]|uniref:sterile alpha motif domain-containing protein 11 isoform X2 n=1 Tax=Amia ocellicauda TaxID=2972642 RepID=UPI003463C7E2
MSGISCESQISCCGQERRAARSDSVALNPLAGAEGECEGSRRERHGEQPVNPDARRRPHSDRADRRDQLRRDSGEQLGADELLITCYRRVAFSTMPAIKKERLDGDESALAGFSQSEYLAPLNAAAIPVVTPHPPPYEQLFSHHHHHHHHHRAYLGLHDAHQSLPFHHPHQHQHHHRHPEDLMLERFSSIPDFQPFFDNGEPCIEVECGENKALLYINKLCQGSKGPSIKYRGEWLTPNEFQFVSGRETAKDWKRSIRHKGKSLKTLMSKGILQNRGRLAEKRTIPLPPTRIPKKELASIFSSDDSEESERTNGDHADIKQEDDLNVSIMKKSRDSDLSTIISNLHHTRQLVMPESQTCSEIKRNGSDIGSAPADEILGKRRAYSPSSECLSESKKSRSVSPKENSQTPVLELSLPGPMTPEEHYRRMMSALNEHGSYEEQQQRLYQLANSMGVPSHGDLLRARQEAVSGVRNPGSLEAHLPSAGSSSSQRRKQGLPQHRDAHFSERDITHPPPLLSPQNAPHIALGPHLRPPFLGMPSALCQAPGYGFLQPAQAEMFARQQEMLRKQNLARLEMSAELLRQKELENLHRQRLLGDPLGLPPGLPPDHPALRSLHDIPEGHPLREELTRRNAMLVLRHNNTPLLSLNHQGVAPGATPPKESARKSSRKGGQARGDLQCPLEAKDHPGEARAREGGMDGGQDEEMKDSESDAEVGEDRAEVMPKSDGHHMMSSDPSQGKDGANTKPLEGSKDLSEVSGRQSAPCVSAGAESPGHHPFTVGINKSDAKYLPPGIVPPLPPQPLPFGFPYTASPYFHTGTMGGLFLDGEEAGPMEDISKWTVDEVCGFIGSLSGCTEYTQVFREQAIDGETLPLLTEDHLLNNMGLKLGPALKVRSQVARRIGRVLYMTSFPLAFPLQPSALRPPDRDPPPVENRPPSSGSVSSPYSAPPASRISPKQENGNSSSVGIGDTTKPPS